ncbi:hypothetical protein L0F63_005372 [Massospora cicadina]|nr:hypothetical protein L0F63_005372 [Massospora cicadina]
MNIDALLVPVSDDRPCGENLEYDADYMAMDQASEGKAEQQFGTTIIPAEPTGTKWSGWRAICSPVLKICGSKGLPGYANGLALIEQALNQWWTPLWPMLEGMGIRILFIESMRWARLAPLLRSASDEISLRDACALLDGSKTDCPDYPGSARPGVEALLDISERLQTIQATLVSHLGETGVPEMTQLMKTVQTVAQACVATDLSTLIPAAQPQEITSERPVQKKVSHGVDWRSAQPTSRADAQLMLEKVKQYFVQHEPSHPAPLMIDRVQRMIEMDFMDIIRDLAPDGVHQLENIFGRRDG